MFNMSTNSKNSSYNLTEEERVYFAVWFHVLKDPSALVKLAALCKKRGKPIKGEPAQLLSSMPTKINKAIVNGDTLIREHLLKFGIDPALSPDQQDMDAIRAACDNYTIL